MKPKPTQRQSHQINILESKHTKHKNTMEATSVFYQTKAQIFTPFYPPNRIQKLGNLPSSLRFKCNNNGVVAIGCLALGSSPSPSPSPSPSSSSVVVKMDNPEEEEEEWMKIGNLREKCKGERSGTVELLECLEREAIMGDDEGKEPTDYNRRAHIFDKSSKVFQALKETK